MPATATFVIAGRPTLIAVGSELHKAALRQARQVPAPAPTTPDQEQEDTMARRKKAAAVPPALMTDPDTIRRWDGDIRNAEQRRDDGAMAVAGLFKQAERVGVHREAFKFARKLSKMSREKMRDFWRAAGLYVPILCDEHLAQADIFEEADARQQEGAAEAGGHDSDADAEGEQDEAPFDTAAPEPVEAETVAGAPDADWGESLTTAGDDPALDSAGYTFEAGRQAGLRGEAADACPHEAGTATAAIWERGRAKGSAEAEAAAAATEDAATEPDDAVVEVEPEPARAPRRRRVAGGDNVVPLH